MNGIDTKIIVNNCTVGIDGVIAVRYVVSEPGNGIQYRLLFTSINGLRLDEFDSTADSAGRNGWIITNLNSKVSIQITDNKQDLYPTYVQAQMKVSASDSVHITAIIARFTGRPIGVNPTFPV
jgi:hypothetical protein